MVMGGSRTIKVTGTSAKPKWSVSNTSVLKIKQKGNSVTVYPKKAGTAKVICRVNGKSLPCTVKVLNNNVECQKQYYPGVLVYKYYAPVGFLDKSLKVKRYIYDKNQLKMTVLYKNSQGSYLGVKALKMGTLKFGMEFSNGTKEVRSYTVVPWFRDPNSKLGKKKANYDNWRKYFIKTCVKKNTSTWEVIDMICTLISYGVYSGSGGVSSLQLWYGGNGTCVSGAQMVHDFMNDLGIKNKVHFAGKDNDPGIWYGSEHYNTHIWFNNGKHFVINAQPGQTFNMDYHVIDK